MALVNSDVELPELWLERLMLPILESDDVASSTPYTNCGTLVSFPKMGEDNSLFKDFTLAEIDENFRRSYRVTHHCLPASVFAWA